VALQPAALQPVELMMVRATRCQTSVRRQTTEGRVRSKATISLQLG
jgi:hypothetical protein